MSERALDWRHPQPDTPRVNSARELGTIATVLEACKLERENAELLAAAKTILDQFTTEHLDMVSGTKCGTELSAAIAKAESK